MTSQMSEDDAREPLGVPDTSTTDMSVLAVTGTTDTIGDEDDVYDVDDEVTLAIVNPLLAASSASSETSER